MTRQLLSPYKRAFQAQTRKTLGYGVRTTPSSGATKALIGLLQYGPMWASQLARAIEYSQPNLTNLILPRLEEMGLVVYDRETNPRGGRPLHVYRLTERGEEIAILADTESRAVAR